MSQLEVLIEVYEIAAQAGFWAAFGFPVLTALFWPWWQTWWGRNLVALDVAIALALLNGVLQIEFGMKPRSTPGHVLLWVTVVALCLVPMIIVWRAVLTFGEQRRGRRRDAS